MRVNAVLQFGPRWCPMCGHMGAWGWVMMLLWLVVLVAIVGAFLFLLQETRRRGGDGGGGAPAPESAEELLRRRYARGEIDRDTYFRMLDDLKRGSPS